MTRCFVIGPIGDKMAPIGSERREIYESALAVLEDVIVPACSANGLDPIRADQIAKTGEITEQVFRHLLQDEVVIADLSGANANVMYELGLRHTTNLLTITIGEYGLLPFDVSAIRTFVFSRSERGLIEVRKQLQQAIAIGLAEGSDPVTATRVWLSMSPDEALGEAVAAVPPDDVDEDGFLERLADVEEGFPEMTEILGEISAIMEDLGEVGEGIGQDVESFNAGAGSARERLNLVGRWSSQLQRPADRLTETTVRFEKKMRAMDPQIRGLLEYIEENTFSEPDQVLEFVDSVIGLGAASREGMEGINSFGGVVKGLGAVSKTLRRPGNQMARATDTMAKGVSLIDVWESQAKKARQTLSERE